MVSPTREKCGVTDYTAYLANALRSQTELLRIVDPSDYSPVTDEADIVHIQHQYFFFGGVAPWKNRFRAFAKRLTRPAVMTVHEFAAPKSPAHVRAAIRLTNRMQFSARQISRLIVHTEHDRLRMTAEGFDPGRIEVVTHGVPIRPDLPEKEDAKRDLGVDGRFVVTLFGFLSRRKGHGIAIEAMSRVPSDVILLIAGGRHPDDKSDYPNMLDSMIAAEGLSDRVRVTGYLPAGKVEQVMAATDLVIAPFTESSGSGSLALAFACGKAILVSDIAPHREIDADAVRLVKNDPADWAVRIADMAGCSDGRMEMERGAEKYAASHSYDRMAAETVDVYRRVLGRAAE